MSDNVRQGKFFAWCVGIRGLYPMKFHEGINKTDDQSIVQSHEIEDLSLSFGELAKLFPAPVSEEHPVAWPDYGKVRHERRDWPTPVDERTEGPTASQQPEPTADNPGIPNEPGFQDGIYEIGTNGHPLPYDTGQRLLSSGIFRVRGPDELQRPIGPENSLRRRLQKAVASFWLPLN